MLTAKWSALCAVIVLAVSSARPALSAPRKVNLHGKITAVQAATATTPATATIQAKSGSVTVNVTPATKIEAPGGHGTFSDLLPGEQVEAQYQTPGNNALHINIQHKDRDVQGTISAVNSGASPPTVTI